MKKTIPMAMSFMLILLLAILVQLSNAVFWSGETQLTSEYHWDGFPSVAQSSDNKIWLVWQTDRMGLPGVNYEIFYRVYDGSVWTQDALLFQNRFAQDINPTIFKASNGTLLLFWACNESEYYNIYQKSSVDNGASWSNSVRVTDVEADDFAPSVYQEKDGTIWLVWYRKLMGNYDIFFKTYSSTSFLWSSDTRLTTDTAPDKLPSVAQLKDGKIWVVWQSYRGGNMDIYYTTSSDEGASWSVETRLTTETDWDTDPAIYQTIYGYPWIVYSTLPPTPSGYNDLYYKTSMDNGTTWSSRIQITTDKFDDSYPALTQSLDRKIWIAWASNRVGQPDGNLELFYKTTIPREGDVNGDWIVNIIDLARVARAYKARVGQPRYDAAADLNNDGIVDVWDLYIVATHYAPGG